MSRAGHSIDRIVDRVTAVFLDFSGSLLAIVVVLINVEIVLRYVIGKSTLIADEYSGYFLVWMSLLGFGYALQSGQFLSVGVFIRRRSKTVREIAASIGAIVGAILALITMYGCWHTVLISFNFGTRSIQASATPIWLPQMAMPIAFAWLAVLYARMAIKRISTLVDGEGQR